MTDPVEAFLTALKAGDFGAMRLLLDEHPDLARARVQEGTSLLLLAAYYRNPNATALLVERGSPVGVPEAAALGDAGRVATLLDADSSRRDEQAPDGWTPLHLAAHFDHVDVARELLRRGAPAGLRSGNANENTPLHAAAAGRAASVAQLLVGAGADVNAKDAGGHTPLHIAAANNDLETIRVLLDHGADPHARSRDGQTPADAARTRGSDAAVKRLEAALRPA